MNTVQEFTWSDRYLLGHSAMDDTHREFVLCVDALLTASDAGIPEALEAFIRHAEAHFKQENDWLAAPDFPGGGGCHIEEHIALNNAPDVARAYARALVDWFPGHADYMDSALAAWLVKRTHNGRPLVFRRKEAV